MPRAISGDHVAGLTSIVVASDFSPGAGLALRRVARLPLAPGARVSILNVLPSDIPAKHRSATLTIATEWLESDVRTLKTLARAAGNENLKITVASATGRAYEEITKHAKRRKAQLIVIGRHGHRTLNSLVIGTTAQRVVRFGGIPVLVVNLEAGGPYRRPLLATDLGANTRRIAELALRVIGRRWVSLPLVHAWDIPGQGWITLSDIGSAGIPFFPQYRDEISEEMEATIDSLRKVGMRVTFKLRRGDPREVVPREAERREADLVITGTHGRTGARRVLLGSVAESVVANAKCDVLIAR